MDYSEVLSIVLLLQVFLGVPYNLYDITYGVCSTQGHAGKKENNLILNAIQKRKQGCHPPQLT